MKVINRIGNTLTTDIGIDVTFTSSGEYVFNFYGHYYTYTQLQKLKKELDNILEMDEESLIQYLKINFL
jgi:hypothetical protein